jgi:hypothetical protein
LPTIALSVNKSYLSLPTKYVATADNAQSAIVEHVIITHSVRLRDPNSACANDFQPQPAMGGNGC